MTPPSVPLTSQVTDRAGTAAGSLPLETLCQRRDFLLAARGRKVTTPGFILQIRQRQDEDGPTRVGFTCSKKVGNAVARNRAKRRLREVARAVLSDQGALGTDYVLIGRARVTAARKFALMLDDLRSALKGLP